MMKSKDFIFSLLIIFSISFFVSCSDSEPPVYEKGNLIGNYVGNCIISLSSKSETLSDFPAVFKQKDAQNLYLDIGNDNSYKSIGIFISVIASGFKDYGSYAKFNLGNINDIFKDDQIPDFIKNNVPLNGNPKSVTLDLKVDSKNPPKYTMASENLTFTYTGNIKVTGVGEEYNGSITYTFNLNKR